MTAGRRRPSLIAGTATTASHLNQTIDIIDHFHYPLEGTDIKLHPKAALLLVRDIPEDWMK